MTRRKSSAEDTTELEAAVRRGKFENLVARLLLGIPDDVVFDIDKALVTEGCTVEMTITSLGEDKVSFKVDVLKSPEQIGLEQQADELIKKFKAGRL